MTMPWYTVAATGPDNYGHFDIEHDATFTQEQFEALVLRAAGIVALESSRDGKDAVLNAQFDDGEPAPWWVDMLPGVVDWLCENEGFRCIVPMATVERDEFLPFTKFAPNADEILALHEALL